MVRAVKNKATRYREAAIASVLRFITPHCAIKNDKCPNYLHFPRLQPMPCASWSAVSAPISSTGFSEKKKKTIRNGNHQKSLEKNANTCGKTCDIGRVSILCQQSV